MDDLAVVIAGGGPTGLMLAGELALAGVDVAVVERRPNQELSGARALGISELRLALTHVLRNCLAPLIVAITLNVGGMITALAGLSFLGLGVQPPYATWGNILNDGKDLITYAWWLTLYPGLAILITVLSYNLVGEGIRDALDPRLRQSGVGRAIRVGR